MATDALFDIPGYSIIGQAPQKGGSYVLILMVSLHGKIAEGLNARGIAIRSEHHCTQIIYIHVVWRSINATYLQFITVLEI